MVTTSALQLLVIQVAINYPFGFIAAKIDFMSLLLIIFYLYFLCSEAHPDVIGSNGVASLEAYHNDLAYLKRKVLLLFYCNSSF